MQKMKSRFQILRFDNFIATRSDLFFGENIIGSDFILETDNEESTEYREAIKIIVGSDDSLQIVPYPNVTCYIEKKESKSSRLVLKEQVPTPLEPGDTCFIYSTVTWIRVIDPLTPLTEVLSGLKRKHIEIELYQELSNDEPPEKRKCSQEALLEAPGDVIEMMQEGEEDNTERTLSMCVFVEDNLINEFLDSLTPADSNNIANPRDMESLENYEISDNIKMTEENEVPDKENNNENIQNTENVSKKPNIEEDKETESTEKRSLTSPNPNKKCKLNPSVENDPDTELPSENIEESCPTVTTDNQTNDIEEQDTPNSNERTESNNDQIPDSLIINQTNSNNSDNIQTASSSRITREKCRYGDKCYRRNTEHKTKFSHSGDADYDQPDNRPECEYGLNCYRKNPQHRQDYKHTAQKRTRTRARRNSQSLADLEDLSDSSLEESVDESDYDPSFIDDDSEIEELSDCEDEF